MNNEEIQALMGKLQEAGLKPEDIADGVLWPLFRDGKMSKEDLSTLCSAIGLELDEDFDKDDHAEPSEEAPEGEITKEEAEEAKEIAPGEDKEEFEEKLEESKGDEEVEGDEEPSEEEEWEEAKKLFKL